MRAENAVPDRRGAPRAPTEPSRQSRRMALLKRAGLFGGSTFGAVVSRATSVEDLVDGYRLVHDVFVERGYIRPQPFGVRMRAYEALASTATFVAKAADRVVGVQSLVADGCDLGLPSEGAFRAEIGSLRGQGRRICEATSEAVASSFRKTGVPTELMRCCFAQARAVGCDELVVTVSPGHARFYGLLGFEQISPMRSYSREIEDPVVLIRLNFQSVDERSARVRDGDADDDAFFKRYYIDDNPYHRHVEAWRILAERTFLDPVLLRELFVNRSDLLSRCSPGELKAIAENWGEEVFARVRGAEPTVLAQPRRIPKTPRGSLGLSSETPEGCPA